MKTSAKNIVANFMSKVWGFLSLYLFSRFYLSLAGAEQFGVISYYTLIFGIVSFADVGISASLTREFAKQADNNYLIGLLHFFEKLFIPICFTAGMLICIFSKSIGTYWLISKGIPLSTLAHYICLIGIGVATQLMSSIYFGALMGKQLQVWVNSVQIVLNIAKTTGGVLLLYLNSSNLYLFFIWQIICNVAFVFVLRNYIFRSLYSPIQKNKFSGVPREVWKYMGSMTLIAILSALAIQSDKLVASKYLQSSDFGFYTLASTLSQLPVLLIIPIGAATFPVLVKNYTRGSLARLNRVYELTSFAVVILVLPLCCVLIVYGEDIFHIWLSSKNVQNAPKEIISYLIFFLTLGNTFQALQYMPFNLLMAVGKTKYTIYQAAAEVFFLIPALLFSITHFGLAGIGIPWFIVKLSGYVYLMVITKNLRAVKIEMSFGKTILQPLLCCLIVTSMVYYIFQLLPPNFFSTIAAVILTGGLSVVLNAFLYDRQLFKIQKVKALLK